MLVFGLFNDQPVFDLSRSDARRELRQMAEAHKPLDRPVIVLGGYLDPGLLTASLADDLQDVFPDGQVIAVSFSMTSGFEACRARVLSAIEEAAPYLLASTDPDTTEPVDVIAISMGGLVARYMAMPRDDGGKRLQIARLWTISTPHQGAGWAKLPSFNRKQTDMRPGSELLMELNAADRSGYETTCYVRLRDSIVGPSRAAPPDETAWWVDTPFWQSPHLGAPSDPRIVADICRRLRGEAPYTTTPPAALP